MSLLTFLVTCLATCLVTFLIAPLQAVVLFFAPHAKANGFKLSLQSHGAGQPSHSPSHSALRSSYSAPLQRTTATPQGVQRASRAAYPHRTATVCAKPIHRVRVVRNVDTSLPADRAGRMVVSGRFADVCAELDRLAATELRAA
jgi:hypothetical protein